MIAQKRIFHIFAVLAFTMHVMAQLAPLWMPQDATSIQICTSQGIQTVSLDENGQPAPDRPPAPKHDCPFCLAQTTFATNAYSPNITASTEAYETAAVSQKNGIFLAPSYKTPAHPSRAPPLFS